jgi:hypothetical protein
LFANCSSEDWTTAIFAPEVELAVVKESRAMTKLGWFAGSAVLLFGIGVAGYATIDPSSDSKERAAEAESGRYDGTEHGIPGPGDGAAGALRKSVAETLKQSSKGPLEMPPQDVETATKGIVSGGAASSSRDAADLARKLFVEVRKSKSISRREMERLIALQRQMDEAEVEETARLLQELLKLPNMDTSAL